MIITDLDLRLVHIRGKVGHDDLVGGLLGGSRCDSLRAIRGGHCARARRRWGASSSKNLRLARVPASVGIGAANATGAGSDNLTGGLVAYVVRQRTRHTSSKDLSIAQYLSPSRTDGVFWARNEVDYATDVAGREKWVMVAGGKEKANAARRARQQYIEKRRPKSIVPR